MRESQVGTMKTNFVNESFEDERDNDQHGTDARDIFVERVRSNQRKLTSELRHQYDFIVCGSGSSGSVVARRLAENPDVSVLLLEAGGSDDVPSVIEANQWPMNLGTNRDWSFQGQPNLHVNNRSIPFSMGKVLGGGSSINVMVWARGHQSDSDFFASETGAPAWAYESVLQTYRRIQEHAEIRDFQRSCEILADFGPSSRAQVMATVRPEQ